MQAAPGAATKAQKVRSSRYEWESKSNNENEKPVVASRSRDYRWYSDQSMLRKLFSGNRGHAQGQLL